MVKRTRFDDSDCPVARSVDAIGDWWSLLIVRDAFDGSRRFGEFQRSLGVAKNILSARLRTLVAGGILESVPAPDGGAHNEYELTEKGREALPRHRRAASVGRGAVLRTRRTPFGTDRSPPGPPPAPAGGPGARRPAPHAGRDGRHQTRRHHDTPPPAGPIGADYARRCR